MTEVYIKVDPNTNVIIFSHRHPFDPINGLGLSREELAKTGFFVDEYPSPNPIIGKRAIAKYDHERKAVYYEYEPTPFTIKSRLDLIEESTNEMLLMVGSLLGGMMGMGGDMTSPINATINSTPVAKVYNGVATPVYAPGATPIAKVNNGVATPVSPTANTTATPVMSVPNSTATPGIKAYTMNSTSKKGTINTAANATKAVNFADTSAVETPVENTTEDTASAASTIGTNSTANALYSGLAKYFASQIYQGKMSKVMIYQIYPYLKDQIEAILKDWESAPKL